MFGAFRLEISQCNMKIEKKCKCSFNRPAFVKHSFQHVSNTFFKIGSSMSNAFSMSNCRYQWSRYFGSIKSNIFKKNRFINKQKYANGTSVCRDGHALSPDVNYRSINNNKGGVSKNVIFRNFGLNYLNITLICRERNSFYFICQLLSYYQ